MLEKKGIDKSIRQACYDAKARCTNSNHRLFRYYGGRGIEFKFSSPSDLYQEIGDKPDKTYSLDRIDNDGHYESGNVRWATKKQQIENRRSWEKPWLSGNNHNAKHYLVTHPDGTVEEVFNLAEFCRRHGLDKGNLSSTASPNKPHCKTHKGYKAQIKEVA